MVFFGFILFVLLVCVATWAKQDKDSNYYAINQTFNIVYHLIFLF